MRFFNFSKMDGAGNDFIVVDALEGNLPALSSEDIISLCDRKKGVGADGILILNRGEETPVSVDFYNSDGKRGSLCGNGARCVIRYCSGKDLFSGGELRFKFGEKVYSGRIDESGQPVFFMARPAKLKTGFRIKARGSLITSHYCDTGSPHVIINIEDVPLDPKNPFTGFSELDSFPVLDLGREIRHHNDFAPGGVNVNFVRYIDKNSLEIRTFERGVEDETDACGTGSTAAAIVFYALGKCEPPVNLKTKSGDTLTINFEIIDNKLENLSLTGPAEINFHGTVELK
ncbi:MAG: diaminopimelate epimerase [Bacteroidetes bacterium]|nr:diaminopimelate epimerase [Bacteroidota bacterium]